jgi:homeobox protein HoxA/B/C/D4
MNSSYSSAGVDPKFPPSEEYSQSSYIPSPNTADFFINTSPQGNPVVQQQQYTGYQHHHPQYGSYPGYHYHHPPVHPGVVQPQQPPQHHVYHPMHQNMQQPPPAVAPCLQPVSQSIPVSLQSASMPVVSVSNGGSLDRLSPPPPESPSTTVDQHSNLGDYVGDESGPDEDEDDSGSDQGSDRVIYPWMRKIHVAGVGECPTSMG